MKKVIETFIDIWLSVLPFAVGFAAFMAIWMPEEFGAHVARIVNGYNAQLEDADNVR